MGFISLPADSFESYLNANRPVAAGSDGKIIYISDVGINGSHWVSNGSIWSPVGGELVVAQSAASSSVTGTVSETTLATYTIPGGMVHANGCFEINMLYTYTNSANNKTIRVRLGGISGTIYYTPIVTTTASAQGFCIIRCANSVSSQKGFGPGTGGISGFGNVATALTTSSVNLNSNSDIVITGQLANSGETITLNVYSIVYRG